MLMKKVIEHHLENNSDNYDFFISESTQVSSLLFIEIEKVYKLISFKLNSIMCRCCELKIDFAYKFYSEFMISLNNRKYSIVRYSIILVHFSD